jgi:hypothetical protein
MGEPRGPHRTREIAGLAKRQQYAFVKSSRRAFKDLAGQLQKQKEPAGESREHDEYQGFETVQPPDYPQFAGLLIVHARSPI